MSIAEQTREFTIEDLLHLPDDGRSYELVDGELQEVNVSNLSVKVALKLSLKLEAFCEANSLGEVFGSDAYFQCFPDLPKHARKPDVSFIRATRLPADWQEQGYFTIAPDLAVEVISPGDLAYEVDRKIAEYLQAGVSLVWQVNPEERTIVVHRANGSLTRLREPDTLSGEEVIPGFTCRVSEIFPKRP